VAKTVLIVDDNEFIRQALCELFQRQADFEVCADAENGREAIEMAEQLRPDLIVLDLSMPVMNGLGCGSGSETHDAYDSADYVQRLRRQIRGAASATDRNLRGGLEI